MKAEYMRELAQKKLGCEISEVDAHRLLRFKSALIGYRAMCNEQEIRIKRFLGRRDRAVADFDQAIMADCLARKGYYIPQPHLFSAWEVNPNPFTPEWIISALEHIAAQKRPIESEVTQHILRELRVAVNLCKMSEIYSSPASFAMMIEEINKDIAQLLELNPFLNVIEEHRDAAIIRLGNALNAFDATFSDPNGVNKDDGSKRIADLIQAARDAVACG